MSKVYFRIVYWRRRLARRLGWPSPGRARAAYRRMSDREWRERTRAPRVFAVIVLVVLAVSAALGTLNLLLAPGGGLPF